MVRAVAAQRLQDGGPQGQARWSTQPASPAPSFVSHLNQRPLAQDLNAAPGDFRGNDESLEEGGHFGP